jgi:hypothetical protein
MDEIHTLDLLRYQSAKYLRLGSFAMPFRDLHKMSIRQSFEDWPTHQSPNQRLQTRICRSLLEKLIGQYRRDWNAHGVAL